MFKKSDDEGWKDEFCEERHHEFLLLFQHKIKYPLKMITMDDDQLFFIGNDCHKIVEEYLRKKSRLMKANIVGR